MIRTISKLAVAAFLLCFSATATAQIAVVNGESISAQEVEDAAVQDLSSIESRRVQFDVQLNRDRKAALESALERIITDRLMAAEARKRNVSVDDLLVVAPPADETIAQFYAANRTRIQGSLEDNIPGIRNYLREQQRQAAFDTLAARLRNEYSVKSYLEPARTAIVTTGRPSKGVPDAPVTIVEFSDFQCPFCGGLFPTLQQIQFDYKDRVRIVYMQFPLVSIHPDAQKAAEASLCAHEQNKFWQLHDAMFEDQGHLALEALKEKASKLLLDMPAFNACVDSDRYLREIGSDVSEAVKAGVSGTPALFINGRFLEGNQPYADIQKVIEDELRRASAN